MVGRDGPSQVVLQRILQGPHVPFQKLHAHFCRTITLWIPSSRSLGNDFPRPMFLQLPKERGDRHFGVTAERHSLVPQAVQVLREKLQHALKTIVIDTLRGHNSGIETFAFAVPHNQHWGFWGHNRRVGSNKYRRQTRFLGNCWLLGTKVTVVPTDNGQGIR